MIVAPPYMKRPRFSGKNISKFISKYEIYAENYLLNEAQKVSRITSCMKYDHHVDTIISMMGYKLNCWHFLVNELKTEFASKDKRYDIDGLSFIKMTSDDDLDDHLRRFDSFVSRMDDDALTDQTKSKFLYSSLTRKFQRKVAARFPNRKDAKYRKVLKYLKTLAIIDWDEFSDDEDDIADNSSVNETPSDDDFNDFKENAGNDDDDDEAERPNVRSYSDQGDVTPKTSNRDQTEEEEVMSDERTTSYEVPTIMTTKEEPQYNARAKNRENFPADDFTEKYDYEEGAANEENSQSIEDSEAKRLVEVEEVCKPNDEPTSAKNQSDDNEKNEIELAVRLTTFNDSVHDYQEDPTEVLNQNYRKETKSDKENYIESFSSENVQGPLSSYKSISLIQNLRFIQEKKTICNEFEELTSLCKLNRLWMNLYYILLMLILFVNDFASSA